MTLFPDLSWLDELSVVTLVIICLVTIALFVLNIIGNWMLYKKAGEPGWAALVPFYKDYVSFKVFWGEGFLFIVPLAINFLCNTPILGMVCYLFIIVINALTAYKTSIAYGKSIGFAVGLFFWPIRWIFALMIGTDSSVTYKGVPIDGTSWKDICRMLNVDSNVLHKGTDNVTFDNKNN